MVRGGACRGGSLGVRDCRSARRRAIGPSFTSGGSCGRAGPQMEGCLRWRDARTCPGSLQSARGRTDEISVMRYRLLLLAVLALPLVVLVPTGSAAAAGPSYVTRSGSTLQLDGKPWRFSGANMYWLGLDDNLRDSAGPTYPTQWRIDNGFASAQALGARVVRAHTLGVSVGCPRCLQPAPGVFNDQAFGSIDYAVASARRHGVRLMIPLTDQWGWYHGGKRTFTRWRGYPDDPGQNAATSSTQRVSEAKFYTDPLVIADFRAYVAYLLNHVNPRTGIRLGDDPTIAIWETGNELWDAPVQWTEQTARYIKTLAPRSLVADGSAATGMHVANAAIDAPSVDVVGGHFYPTDRAWARTDAQVAAAHGKVYVVGEFPLTGEYLAGWLGGLARDRNVTGDLAWTLLPYLEDGSPEPHGDGYVFHYPGATAAEQAQVTALARHARYMARS